MEESYWCGPEWFPKWLTKWLSQRLNNACLQHDIDYQVRDKTRWQADLDFFKHCWLFAPHAGWKVIAIIFFFMVRLGGWVGWPKETKNKDLIKIIELRK